MAPIVNRHGGFIDKFIGDAVMALFPERPDEALQAGIEMQRELRVYNLHRAALGYEPIDIGIGLHIGDIMLGIIGHENRMEGTVISDTVNTASRVEGLTRRYGAAIIVSQAFLDALEQGDGIETRRLGLVKLKGKSSAHSVYHVLNGYSEDVQALFLASRDRFHEAVDLAYGEDYARAAEIFAEIHKANPRDDAARFYVERIRSRLKLRA